MTEKQYSNTLKKLFFMLRCYFVREPGALFIIVFQAFIFSCAFLLIRGDEALANDVAVYAYGFLVVGVVLQALSALRAKASRSGVG